jgi:hypothetical protein
MSNSDRHRLYELEHEAMEAEQRARQSARLDKLEYKIRAAELNQKLKLRSRELRIKTVETYFRTGIAAILVAILAVAIFVGILKKIPAADLTQYLTPISGLAGIAIGYFFGRAADRSSITDKDTADEQNAGSSEPADDN